MKTKPARTATASVSTVHAEHVGTAEFRGNLAKYLRQAKAGRPVVVQERGKNAYVLLKFEEQAPPSVFGCMRDHTDLGDDAVLNASASIWRQNKLP